MGRNSRVAPLAGRSSIKTARWQEILSGFYRRFPLEPILYVPGPLAQPLEKPRRWFTRSLIPVPCLFVLSNYAPAICRGPKLLVEQQLFEMVWPLWKARNQVNTPSASSKQAPIKPEQLEGWELNHKVVQIFVLPLQLSLKCHEHFLIVFLTELELLTQEKTHYPSQGRVRCLDQVHTCSKAIVSVQV